MQGWLRTHLTYANVAATIALFVALGGAGAYAGSQIGANDIANNAIRDEHIKADEVKKGEIKDGQVRGPEVLDESLTGADIDEPTLEGVDADKAGGGGVCRDSRTLVTGDPEETVCTAGPLTLSARCNHAGGGNIAGHFRIDTSQNDAYFKNVTQTADTNFDDNEGQKIIAGTNAGLGGNVAVETQAIAAAHPGTGAQLAGVASVRVTGSNGGPTGTCDFAVFGAG